VERSKLKGKPLFIYFSFDSASPKPLPWLTSIRWSRIGGRVH
jgi:signal peptidase I